MRPRGSEFRVYPKKIHGSIIFYFYTYDKNGKRRFRTTGKKNFDEAVRFCRNLQLKNQLHDEESLSFNAYTKDFFIFEKCPYINFRITRGHSYTRSWAKRQRYLLENILNQYFGAYALYKITFKEIGEFLLSLKNQNFSNKKLNHIITTLKNIFGYAEMERKIETNPCTGFKPFKVESPEKGVLTRDELDALFNEENRSQIWPEKMYFIINYMAVSTGLRLGELLALKPKDITSDLLKVSHSFNTDDGLKSTKNGKARVVRLYEKLVTLLTDFCREKQQDEFIFSLNNGKSPINHKTVYKRFWKALEKIGINKNERKHRNITFHSYRHYLNTYLLQSGWNPETVRLLLGHSGSTMTARYSHIQLPVPDIFGMQEKSATCPKKNETNNTIPTYITELINKGFLFPDGKRVVKSLNNVALEIHKITQSNQLSEGLLRELFVKPNGEQYSIKACKSAVNFANTV